MSDRFKMDFIGVGVEKAGTTWLGQCLAEHPEICFSSQKEVCFFNKNYEQGTGFYRQFFKHCQGEKLKGEYTPGYFYYDGVAQRIKDNFPEAKLIFSFRAPIERTYSEFKDAKAHGRISDEINFTRAIKQEKVLVKHSFYSRRLQEYLRLFSDENIHIIIYRDIVERPQEVIRDLYNFLGVDLEFVPASLSKKIHVSAEKRYRVLKLAKLIRRIMRLGTKVKKFWWGRFLIKVFTWLGIKKLLQSIFRLNRHDSKTEDKKPISPETKQILKEEFKNDINTMNKLVDKDLDFWLYD